MGRPTRKSSFVTQSLADRLSELLAEKKESGVSLRKITAECGIASSLLSEWASDYKTPTLENIVVLAKYFGVSTDYLLGLTHIRNPDPTIQGIAKYTGLDENSIVRLNKIATDKPKQNPILELIDSLLSNRSDHDNFVEAIGECIYWSAWAEASGEVNFTSGLDIDDYFDKSEIDRKRILAELEEKHRADDNATMSAILNGNSMVPIPVHDVARLYIKRSVNLLEVIVEDAVGVLMRHFEKELLKKKSK